MPQFVVRVDLANGSDEQRRALRSSLERHGFERTIRGTDGARFQLPACEYSYFGAGTLRSIRNLAWKICSEVSPSCAVLVTKGPSAWNGLTRATEVRQER